MWLLSRAHPSPKLRRLCTHSGTPPSRRDVPSPSEVDRSHYSPKVVAMPPAYTESVPETSHYRPVPAANSPLSTENLSIHPPNQYVSNPLSRPHVSSPPVPYSESSLSTAAAAASSPYSATSVSWAQMKRHVHPSATTATTRADWYLAHRPQSNVHSLCLHQDMTLASSPTQRRL